MSSQTATKGAHRPSKFIEGSPATAPDLLQKTPTSNELFFSILSKMDELEKKKRQHRGSSSSVDSLASPVANRKSFSEREGRSSTGNGRPSLDAVREMIEEKKSHKFVGRLRALTGGRDKDERRSPYPGT